MYNHTGIGMIIVAMEMSSHHGFVIVFDVKYVTLESVNDSVFWFDLHTLNSTYNKKKYAEIFLCYRWLFAKGNIFIGEGKYLVQMFSFVIADFLLKATSL